MWRKCRNLAKPVSIHTPVWGVTVYVFMVTLKGSNNFFEKRLFFEDFLLNRLNLCEGVGCGWGCNRLHLFFLGRGEGVLEAVGICLYICGQ